jgi:aspartate/methionine/tyrosine aminotransferase
VDSFLDISRKKLRASYDVVTKYLDSMNIPYIEASAGIFVYCDFSSLLPENSFYGEAQFSAFLVDVARVVMTPGQSQHDPRPGFFRICYAAITPDALTIAMQRISSIAAHVKLHGWKRMENIRSYEDLLLKC